MSARKDLEVSREEKITAFLQEHLSILSHQILMEMLLGDDIFKAVGVKDVTQTELEKAVAAFRSNSFDLVVRGPDDYSSKPYIWITPKPKSADPSGAIVTPPDPCWIIRHPNGNATLHIKEGMLVFSQPGFAVGHMTKMGQGDFNVEKWGWKDLVNAAKSDGSAVIDFVEGDMVKNIIPLSTEKK